MTNQIVQPSGRAKEMVAIAIARVVARVGPAEAFHGEYRNVVKRSLLIAYRHGDMEAVRGVAAEVRRDLVGLLGPLDGNVAAGSLDHLVAVMFPV